MMSSFVNKALLLVLFVGLVTKTSCAPVPGPAPAPALATAPTKSPDLCARLPSFRVCIPILQAGMLAAGTPLAGCCNELRLVQKSIALLGRQATCLCVHQILRAAPRGVAGANTPPATPRPIPRLGFGFKALDISAQIEAACGTNLGFSIDVSAPC